MSTASPASGISSFLREIEKNVPTNLEVHIIVDNYATHKHLRVKRWFATRPRFHVHFTPTYASWLNQVEIWFNRITQQAIRRGTFSSVKDLTEQIDHYVQDSNRHAQPFVWTATADSILAKVSNDYANVFTGQHSRSSRGTSTYFVCALSKAAGFEAPAGAGRRL
jgi:putative transposase